MKITPINNYSAYSKTNSQPKNREVSFGTIEGNYTRELMTRIGINPREDMYRNTVFTLYEENGVLKGRLSLEPLDKMHAKRWHREEIIETYREKLASHNGVLTSKDLVDTYFKGLIRILRPEVEAPPTDISDIIAGNP